MKWNPKCNQHCSCNRNGFQGDRNFQNRQFEMNRRQPSRPYYNECNVFAATNTTAATVTGTAATPLAFNTILYSYGSAIRAASGGSRIYITQPGLYQVSYFIDAANTGAAGASVGSTTAYLLRNTTQFAATSTSTALAAGDNDILSATEIFYVSCQDLPATLELTATSTAAVTNYTYLITLNKICTCEGYPNGSDYRFDEGSIPSFGDGFMDGNTNFDPPNDGPDSDIGFGGGVNSGFGTGGDWY